MQSSAIWMGATKRTAPSVQRTSGDLQIGAAGEEDLAQDTHGDRSVKERAPRSCSRPMGGVRV